MTSVLRSSRILGRRPGMTHSVSDNPAALLEAVQDGSREESRGSIRLLLATGWCWYADSVSRRGPGAGGGGGGAAESPASRHPSL